MRSSKGSGRPGVRQVRRGVGGGDDPTDRRLGPRRGGRCGATTRGAGTTHVASRPRGGGGARAFGEGGGAAGLLGRLEARGADLERRLFGRPRGREGDVDPSLQLGDARDRAPPDRSATRRRVALGRLVVSGEASIVGQCRGPRRKSRCTHGYSDPCPPPRPPGPARGLFETLLVADGRAGPPRRPPRPARRLGPRGLRPGPARRAARRDPRRRRPHSTSAAGGSTSLPDADGARPPCASRSSPSRSTRRSSSRPRRTAPTCARSASPTGPAPTSGPTATGSSRSRPSSARSCR